MQDLIKIAKETIEKRYIKGKHTVAAAIRTSSGKVYVGVCMNSQKLDVCSEWVAIGQAMTEGDSEIVMAVAVHRDIDGNYEIYPPCSLCRELYLTYSPEAEIILDDNRKIKAKDLLPHAWTRK